MRCGRTMEGDAKKLETYEHFVSHMDINILYKTPVAEDKTG